MQELNSNRAKTETTLADLRGRRQQEQGKGQFLQRWSISSQSLHCSWMPAFSRSAFAQHRQAVHQGRGDVPTRCSGCVSTTWKRLVCSFQLQRISQERTASFSAGHQCGALPQARLSDGWWQLARSTRAGVDCVGYAVGAATDQNTEATVLSIDGVGAYDHVLRSSMMSKLRDTPSLQGLLLFVRAVYSRPSCYKYGDSSGT